MLIWTGGLSLILIRQSGLESYGRCAQQKHLEDQADLGLIPQPRTLSATVFGTVCHHALQVMETLHNQGRADAGDVAIQTFEYYWHPDHVTDLEPLGIGEWLPRQGYGQLMTRGRNNLRQYYEMLKADPDPLLALENTFSVPIDIDGETHTLGGTLDRLAMRRWQARATQPYLSIEDFKSGKKSTYLRHRTQWTVYSYASMHPSFWTPFEDAGTLDTIRAPLHKRNLCLYPGDCNKDPAEAIVIPRKGRWINLHDSTVKIHDTGWRMEQDYRRLRVALREYVHAHQQNVFPLTLGGETCTYCPFRDGLCGGEPVPDESEMPVWR